MGILARLRINDTDTASVMTESQFGDHVSLNAGTGLRRFLGKEIQSPVLLADLACIQSIGSVGMPSPLRSIRGDWNLAGDAVSAAPGRLRDALTTAATSSHEPNLSQHDKQVFVFSSAGKPVYSYCGDEEELAGLMAAAQAIMSVVQSQGESLRHFR
jgi:hypothetical protein